jgi:hypothetical protein
MNSEPSETLLEVMECIGNELSLQRDANEPLSRYAERLVDEIDLAIPKMLETRECLLQIAQRLQWPYARR